jgi:hypothetical protein
VTKRVTRVGDNISSKGENMSEKKAFWILVLVTILGFIVAGV